MESSAYLSAFFFRYLNHPKTFPISLIAYDKIYVNVDINNLPWNMALYLRRKDIERGEIDKQTLAKAAEYEKEKGEELNVDWWASGLAHYLGWDYRNLRDLNGVLLDIKLQGPKQTQSFLSHRLRQPYQNGQPVYLLLLDNWIRSYMKLTYGDLYADDIYDQVSTKTIANEFFTVQHLIKRTSIFPILTYKELELRNVFKYFPIVLSEALNDKEEQWNINFANLMYRELKRYGRKAKVLECDSQQSVVEIILDWSVPKFEDVPLREIILLKKKGKISSLSKLAEEIRASREVSNLDIAKIFVDRLWKMGKVLMPSIGENIVGVLGEIPLPIPNPLGIVSTANSVIELMKFKKEYSWFIALSEIEKRAVSQTK